MYTHLDVRVRLVGVTIMTETTDGATSAVQLSDNSPGGDTNNAEPSSDVTRNQKNDVREESERSVRALEKTSGGTLEKINLEISRGTAGEDIGQQFNRERNNDEHHNDQLKQERTKSKENMIQQNTKEPRKSVRLAKKKLNPKQEYKYYRRNYLSPRISRTARKPEHGDKPKAASKVRKLRSHAEMGKVLVGTSTELVIKQVNINEQDEQRDQIINECTVKEDIVNTSGTADFVIVIEPHDYPSDSSSATEPTRTNLNPASPLGDVSFKQGMRTAEDEDKGRQDRNPEDDDERKTAEDEKGRQERRTTCGDECVSIVRLGDSGIEPVVIQPDGITQSEILSGRHRNQSLISNVKSTTEQPGGSSPVLSGHDCNWVIRSCDKPVTLCQMKDVIVIENTTEVIWVMEGQVLLPGHAEVKFITSKITPAKVNGSKVIGSLHGFATKRSPPSLTCLQCLLGFSTPSDWLKHRAVCLGPANGHPLVYYCNRCPASFARHRDWVSHRKSHSVLLAKWTCHRCNRKYTSRRDLREHRFGCLGMPGTATGRPRFRCEVCDKAFPYPSALKVHSETHILKHKCPICDHPFTRFYEMTKHVRTQHPDVGAHSCDSCGKVFERLTMLYRHKSDGFCSPNKTVGLTKYKGPEGKTTGTAFAT